VRLSHPAAIEIAARDEPGDPRDQHGALSPMRRRHTQHQTLGRKDTVLAPNTAARSQPMCAVRCRSRWRTGIIHASLVGGDDRTVVRFHHHEKDAGAEYT
jgi:hypothetical protein